MWIVAGSNGVRCPFIAATNLFYIRAFEAGAGRERWHNLEEVLTRQKNNTFRLFDAGAVATDKIQVYNDFKK